MTIPRAHRPQAVPIHKTLGWTITRRDLWEFLAILVFFGLALVLWRFFA